MQKTQNGNIIANIIVITININYITNISRIDYRPSARFPFNV